MLRSILQHALASAPTGAGAALVTNAGALGILLPRLAQAGFTSAGSGAQQAQYATPYALLRQIGSQRGLATDSNPPKFVNAYAVFTSETWNAASAAINSAKVTDVNHELSRRWRSLTDSEKDAFRAKADVLNAPYEEWRGQRETYRKAKGKKYMTGYTLYVSETFKATGAELNHLSGQERSQTALRQVGKNWKELDPSTKDKYNDAAKAMRDTSMGAK